MIADVEDVKFVINFDYPSNSEDYVHRIGRTGRSQRTGTAYTFFTPNNSNKASDLVAVLKEAKQVINPKLQEMASSRSWNNANNSTRGKQNKFFILAHLNKSSKCLITVFIDESKLLEDEEKLTTALCKTLKA